MTIGKVVDLFAGHGIDEYRKTEGNTDGLHAILEWWQTADTKKNLFQFVNLIDTDQLYGHRNDPAGYAKCLEEIDGYLPSIAKSMQEGDVLMITGDHGNDPTTPGTDHTREFVPLLVYPRHAAIRTDLGVLDGFSAVSNAIASYFGLDDRSDTVLVTH